LVLYLGGGGVRGILFAIMKLAGGGGEAKGPKTQKTMKGRTDLSEQRRRMP